MASGLINGESTATTHKTTIPKAEIEAVQSIPPSKVTSPRAVRRVSSPPDSLGLFGGCLHVVLYYNKASIAQEDFDSGSIHAGWIKESLATALSEQPLLAGRLQKGEAIGDKESFVVVSNDAGVRLVEARIGVTLADFFGDPSGSAKAESESEAELVFWKGVAEIDPQFSPLLYVQVTKFKCGGYSFGISCSILLADILLKDNFCKSWAELHNKLLHKNGVVEKPLFYLPNHKKTPSSTISNIFSTNASKDSGQTVMFNVTSAEEINERSSDEFSTLATLCLKKAESKVGTKLAPELIFLIFPSDPNNFVKIEKLLRHELVAKPINSSLANIGYLVWENFGENELQFYKGNRPICVSHWIGSVSTELIMGIPNCYGEKGLRIIVRFANM